MYKLTRISLINWYLVSAQDIEIRNATALIGPTGAGKSSIQDAIQTVICGGNRNYIRTNPSANGKSDRDILSYCLAYTRSKQDGGVPLRPNCETVLALTFSEERPDGKRHDVSVGIAYEAREDAREPKLLNRFIARDHAFSVKDWLSEDDEGSYILPWEEIERGLKHRCVFTQFYRHGTSSAQKFVADMLAVMRYDGSQPDARHFMQVFSNAIAFEPIFNSTQFVRQWILTPDNLDIERVRSSIARWREMNETVERIEKRLKQITVAQGLYRTWGNLLVDRAHRNWSLACANTDLQRLYLRDAASSYHKVMGELETIEKQLTARTRRLEEDQVYLRDLENQLREKGTQQKLDSADKDRERALERLRDLEEKCRHLKEVFQSAGNLKSMLPWLPPESERTLSLAESALSFMNREGGARWLRHHKPEVSGYLDEIRSFFADLPDLLRDNIDSRRERLLDLRRDRDVTKDRLTRAEGDKAILSEGTTELMRLLADEGIESTPVCDVIEISEERWQRAVEGLLGRAREALLVEPARLREAHDILYRNRNRRNVSSSSLVKTTQTSGFDLSRLPGNSIAGVVTSDNRDALAFVAQRIGGFERVETEEDLERSRRGIMANGKMTAGLSYSVQRTDIPLIIGKAAREETARAERVRLKALESEIAGLARELKSFEDLDMLARHLSGVAFDLDEMEDRFLSIQREIAEAEKRRQAVLDEEDRELVAEVATLEETIHEMRREIAEMQEERASIREKRGRVEARLDSVRADLRKAVAAKRRAVEGFADEDLVGCLQWLDDGARKKVLIKNPWLGKRLPAGADGPASDAAKRDLAEGANRLTEDLRHMTTRVARAANDASNSLLGYFRDNDIDPPFAVGSDSAIREFAWIVEERDRLENNELRVYREEAQEAERTMRSTLTEDLLVNLHGRFQRLEHQIRSLNTKLSRHRFNNSYHFFRRRPDPAFDDLRKLAVKVGESKDTAAAIIEGRADDPWLEDALQKLNDFLEDRGGEGLEDYRNYYTFDLYMSAEPTDGRVDISEEEVRSGKFMSLSGRATVGSGGEGQTPFYIAIAASMALAYYPGSYTSDEPSGMGLVLFDEAFGKLDIQTTQTLIRFFGELGLQLVIAAPEDKRATFTEVVDTIVAVNKDHSSHHVYINSEFPGERARQELAAINPERIGVEGFRRMLEGTADAAE